MHNFRLISLFVTTLDSLFFLTDLVLKCSELVLDYIKMPISRGAAPDPAGGATAHPRPPSLPPRAFGARHFTIYNYPSSGKKWPLLIESQWPPESLEKKMDTLRLG